MLILETDVEILQACLKEFDYKNITKVLTFVMIKGVKQRFKQMTIYGRKLHFFKNLSTD